MLPCCNMRMEVWTLVVEMFVCSWSSSSSLLSLKYKYMHIVVDVFVIYLLSSWSFDPVSRTAIIVEASNKRECERGRSSLRGEPPHAKNDDEAQFKKGNVSYLLRDQKVAPLPTPWQLTTEKLRRNDGRRWKLWWKPRPPQTGEPKMLQPPLRVNCCLPLPVLLYSYLFTATNLFPSFPRRH